MFIDSVFIIFLVGIKVLYRVYLCKDIMLLGGINFFFYINIDLILKFIT